MINLLVLAAGWAKRLRPLSDDVAKALIDISGRPAVERLMASFPSVPFGRRVVVSNAKFHPAFADWADGHGATVVNNGVASPAGSRGAVGDLALGVRTGGLHGADLVVAAGDNVFSQPQDAWVAAVRARPAAIATYDTGSVEEVKRFASVEHDREGKVLRLVEKPAAPSSTFAGIALYYFRADCVGLVDDYLACGHDPDNAGSFFEWLTAKGVAYAEPVPGTWFDIGTPRSLDEARDYFSNRGKRGRRS